MLWWLVFRRALLGRFSVTLPFKHSPREVRIFSEGDIARASTQSAWFTRDASSVDLHAFKTLRVFRIVRHGVVAPRSGAHTTPRTSCNLGLMVSQIRWRKQALNSIRVVRYLASYHEPIGELSAKQ